jgi:hypothetical protein
VNYVPGRRSLWVFDFDGIVVGRRISVPHARHVEGPADLAGTLRELEEVAPERSAEKARGGAA